MKRRLNPKAPIHSLSGSSSASAKRNSQKVVLAFWERFSADAGQPLETAKPRFMQKNPGWISSQDFLSQHFSEGSVTHGSRVQLLPSGCAIRRGPGFIVLGQDESAPWQSLAAQNLVRTPVCPIFHGVDVELPGKAEQGKPDRNLEIRVTHGFSGAAPRPGCWRCR